MNSRANGPKGASGLSRRKSGGNRRADQTGRAAGTAHSDGMLRFYTEDAPGLRMYVRSFVRSFARSLSRIGMHKCPFDARFTILTDEHRTKISHIMSQWTYDCTCSQSAFYRVCCAFAHLGQVSGSISRLSGTK